MGIVNLTPDSFSDGGQFYSGGKVDLDRAMRRVEKMVREQADIVDLGGESTRPGASPVSEQEELDRVLPVLNAIRERFDIPVSVDTSNASLIRESARAGASLINDVRALVRDGALRAAAEAGLPVCLMHMQNQPQNMQDEPYYEDVVAEVEDYLRQRVANCITAGIASEKIIIDPGFGFGKTLQHNLRLFYALQRFAAMGYPVLVGVSRKSMIGQIVDSPVDQRLIGSVTMAVLAVQRGAAIVRVHDVAETVQALKVWRATQ